jgi:hypothetical protein
MPTSGPRCQESVLGYNFRLAGHPKESADREAPGNTLSGLLYLYFECLGVGVAGFSALAAERTSSFVNTAKRNGCDSRK